MSSFCFSDSFSSRPALLCISLLVSVTGRFVLSVASSPEKNEETVFPSKFTSGVSCESSFCLLSIVSVSSVIARSVSFSLLLSDLMSFEFWPRSTSSLLSSTSSPSSTSERLATTFLPSTWLTPSARPAEVILLFSSTSLTGSSLGVPGTTEVTSIASGEGGGGMEPEVSTEGDVACASIEYFPGSSRMKLPSVESDRI